MTALLDLSPQLSQVGFGNAIVFELRRDVKGLYYIKILINNSTRPDQGFNFYPVKLDGNKWKKIFI